VPLHKIKQIKVISFGTGENSGLLKNRRRDTVILPPNKKKLDEASDQQQLYVSFSDEINIDDMAPEDKILLLTSSSEIVGWLYDKITSVLKFNKELKSFSEIF
jgi:hypothetical protein